MKKENDKMEGKILEKIELPKRELTEEEIEEIRNNRKPLIVLKELEEMESSLYHKSLFEKLEFWIILTLGILLSLWIWFI